MKKSKLIIVIATLMIFVAALALAACPEPTPTPVEGERFAFSFELNGGEFATIFMERNLPVGSTVTEPPSAPTRLRYIFVGWYHDNVTFNNLVSWPLTMPNAAMTVYARWEESDTRFITFNSMGGSSIETIEVNVGDRLQNLNLLAPNWPHQNFGPFGAHYNFGGWFNNENTTGQPVNNLNNIQNDVELFARWIVPVAPAFGWGIAGVQDGLGFTMSSTMLNDSHTVSNRANFYFIITRLDGFEGVPVVAQSVRGIAREPLAPVATDGSVFSFVIPEVDGHVTLSVSGITPASDVAAVAINVANRLSYRMSGPSVARTGEDYVFTVTPRHRFSWQGNQGQITYRLGTAGAAVALTGVESAGTWTFTIPSSAIATAAAGSFTRLYVDPITGINDDTVLPVDMRAVDPGFFTAHDWTLSEHRGNLRDPQGTPTASGNEISFLDTNHGRPAMQENEYGEVHLSFEVHLPAEKNAFQFHFFVDIDTDTEHHFESLNHAGASLSFSIPERGAGLPGAEEMTPGATWGGALFHISSSRDWITDAFGGTADRPGLMLEELNRWVQFDLVVTRIGNRRYYRFFVDGHRVNMSPDPGNPTSLAPVNFQIDANGNMIESLSPYDFPTRPTFSNPLYTTGEWFFIRTDDDRDMRPVAEDDTHITIQNPTILRPSRGL